MYLKAMLVAIIAFIILLLVLVVVHEFGHFILARKAGVTVHEFSIGMGPKLRSFGKDKKGTEFVFRLLPLGGYVRIKGESPSEEGALSQKDSFLRAGFRWKFAILLGGIAMNIITAWVLFTIGFFHGVKPIQVLPDNVMMGRSESYLMPSYSFLQEQGLLSGTEVSSPAKIESVEPNSLAAKVGLKAGDVITRINGITINTMNIQNTLQQQIGKEITIDVAQNGQYPTIAIQATCPQDSCLLGVGLTSSSPIESKEIKFPLGEAMIAGLHEVKEQTKLTFAGLATLVTKFNGTQSVNKLSGPIGAAKIGQYVLASGGWLQFLMFGGLLSMALAIFNLLPIPALDGGRLLGVVIQTVFRLPLKKYFEIEGWINTVFFVALLLLGFYIMAHDLVRAWGVHIPGMG